MGPCRSNRCVASMLRAADTDATIRREADRARMRIVDLAGRGVGLLRRDRSAPRGPISLLRSSRYFEISFTLVASDRGTTRISAYCESGRGEGEARGEFLTNWSSYGKLSLAHGVGLGEFLIAIRTLNPRSYVEPLTWPLFFISQALSCLDLLCQRHSSPN